MLDTNKTWDLLVVGGGNAALCAALMAREAGSGQGPRRRLTPLPSRVASRSASETSSFSAASRIRRLGSAARSSAQRAASKPEVEEFDWLVITVTSFKQWNEKTGRQRGLPAGRNQKPLV